MGTTAFCSPDPMKEYVWHGGDMGGIRVVPTPIGLTTYVRAKGVSPKSKCTRGEKIVQSYQNNESIAKQKQT